MQTINNKLEDLAIDVIESRTPVKRWKLETRKHYLEMLMAAGLVTEETLAAARLYARKEFLP